MNLQTRVFDDVVEMLPSEENPSPMVRINRLNPLGDAFCLYAKLEWMNPFGSVKDRTAWGLLRDLEDRGEIGPTRPGRMLIEATSGNTGLSLAALASARGYAMRAVVPEKVPLEKKVLLRLAGAELEVMHDGDMLPEGMGEGAIGLARAHAAQEPERFAMANQYENEANTRAHERSTGPEIWRQTEGKVTHVFLGLGTTGTAMGCARFLRSVSPSVRIIGVRPEEGHDVPGVRSESELHATTLLDMSLLDEVVVVEHDRAFARAAELARREGLLAGPSSGLVMEAAARVLERDRETLGAHAKGVGVMVFFDSLFKYISSFVRHDPALADGAVV